MDISRFIVPEEGKCDLSEIKTDSTGKFKSKEKAEESLAANVLLMAEQQEKLYAQDKYALLILFQGMDTAGKDGAIRHVMTGLNPQATQVSSFKQPSVEELDHDYLWRASKRLPERGCIGIFNRSWYEEVLVVRVHDLIGTQKLPKDRITENIWQERYHQIRNYEKYLFENGIIPVKIFLHISKDEQKKRLMERIENKSKNWKISDADIKERAFWDQYQSCYSDALKETSTKHSPWYVVPSDKKWYSRLVISEIIIQTLKNLKLRYPTVTQAQLKLLDEYKKALTEEV